MHTMKRQRNYGRTLGILAMAAGLFSPLAAARQQATAPGTEIPVPATQAAATPAQPPQTGAAQAAQQPETPQVLHLLVGRSLVITSPTKIKRVSLADPNIAEVDVVTPYQVVGVGSS